MQRCEQMKWEKNKLIHSYFKMNNRINGRWVDE